MEAVTHGPAARPNEPNSAEFRSLVPRLRVPVVVLLVTHLLGMVGFHALWAPRGTWLDALFMTFITVTTIGFEEIFPLTTAGRLLTMGVALSGIGSLFYSFTVVLEYVASDEARAARRKRKMQRSVDALSGHFIVAGIGRVGREAIAELSEAGRSVVVVDVGETLETFCAERGLAFVKGDATDDAVLERAGLKRAKGLVVTTSSDATNLYVILTARWLNPELFIVSRAVDNASVPKLERAGANRAISPYAIGGRRLAHLLISPRVVDSFETAMRRGNQALTVDDVLISAHSSAAQRPLGSLDIPSRSGATVLAVLRDGAPTPNPHSDFVLAPGDHLLVIGTDEQLAKLERLLPR